MAEPTPSERIDSRITDVDLTVTPREPLPPAANLTDAAQRLAGMVRAALRAGRDGPNLEQLFGAVDDVERFIAASDKADLSRSEVDTTLGELRTELRYDLIEAITGTGGKYGAEADHYERPALDRASIVRDLTEAYVRLGGDLELGALPTEALPVLNPADVDLREKLRGVAWRAVNDNGGTTATADATAAAVAEALEELAR